VSSGERARSLPFDFDETEGRESRDGAGATLYAGIVRAEPLKAPELPERFEFGSFTTGARVEEDAVLNEPNVLNEEAGVTELNEIEEGSNDAPRISSIVEPYFVNKSAR